MQSLSDNYNESSLKHKIMEKSVNNSEIANTRKKETIALKIFV